MISLATTGFLLGLWPMVSECKLLSVATSRSISTSTKTTKTSTSGRVLEDADAEFDYDLSGYSVRFGKCQHVKTFSDEVAQDEDSTTVFAMKHFVLFRMCPSDQCASCDENYGEYVVEVNQYLENMAEFYRDLFEAQCEYCDDGCVDTDDDKAANNNNNNNNGDVPTCDFCDDCDKYENMEDYNYVDAADYIECQELDIAENDADDGGDDDEDLQLYVGPRCSADGSRIVLDVFSDENCWELYEQGGADVETLLGKQISYQFLKSSYSTSAENCVSCSEDDNIDDDKDNQDEDNVFEMCENIYEMSAKCETKHGFTNGYVKQNGYDNQVINEFEVCTFIDSLAWGSYDEKGEINAGVTQDVIIRYVTPMQKGVLILLSTTLVGIGMLAYYLHRVIDQLTPNANLASQGGTLT